MPALPVSYLKSESFVEGFVFLAMGLVEGEPVKFRHGIMFFWDFSGYTILCLSLFLILAGKYNRIFGDLVQEEMFLILPEVILDKVQILLMVGFETFFGHNLPKLFNLMVLLCLRMD